MKFPHLCKVNPEYFLNLLCPGLFISYYCSGKGKSGPPRNWTYICLFWGVGVVNHEDFLLKMDFICMLLHQENHFGNAHGMFCFLTLPLSLFSYCGGCDVFHHCLGVQLQHCQALFSPSVSSHNVTTFFIFFIFFSCILSSLSVYPSLVFALFPDGTQM